MKHLARSTPLGLPGGPCHILRTIEEDASLSPRVKDDLSEEIENGKDLSNSQADKLYKRMKMPSKLDLFTSVEFTSHVQYRMDLRGITIREAHKGLSEFERWYLARKRDTKMKPDDHKMLENLAWGKPIQFDASRSGLTLVFKVENREVVMVSAWWTDLPNPPKPRPGQCDYVDYFDKDRTFERPKILGSIMLAQKVAQMHLNRIAARPIQIDRAPIRRAAQEVITFAKRLFRNVRPSESIAGFKMRAEGIERDPAATLTIQTLSGKTLKIDILVGWAKGRNAGVDKSGTIAVFVDSMLRFKDAMKKFEKELESHLMHEVTHLTEFKSPLDVKQDISSMGVYYNDPYEIRAYMREIFEEILPFYVKEIRKSHGARAVFNALKHSDRWRAMDPLLTPKNQQTLLKGVTRALEDATAKEKSAAMQSLACGDSCSCGGSCGCGGTCGGSCDKGDGLLTD